MIQNPLHVELPSSLRGGGLVLPYMEYSPHIGEDVFLAPNASVIGRTRLGKQVSIWFGAVLRGDIAEVEVGDGSNIQDNSVLHVGSDAPCIVRNNVVVGHHVILHGCTIEEDSVIGMGAVILNGAVIGKGSLVGARSLVTQGTIIPPYSLVVGTPAKVKRALTASEIKEQSVYAPKYIQVAENYRKMFSDL
ncbi:MAG: gamma carbonic anhydrase family protein [bacterium]|jgi:carbonic anhydrase/acetyltransferase-like protein (isoleucine patch superfamily)